MQPAASASRGINPTLQPIYYKSAPFVAAARKDIARLLAEFAKSYADEPLPPPTPFALFKKVWTAEGWSEAHLRVLEPRCREAWFMSTVRLFLERINEQEISLIRVGALYSVYTLYASQPDPRSTGIRAFAGIQIPLDQFEALIAAPPTLPPPLRATVSYVLLSLIKLDAFHILPPGGYSPRTLPHAHMVRTSDLTAGKRPQGGRPNKAARVQRAEARLQKLEDTLGTHPDPSRPPNDEYIEKRRALVNELDEARRKEAERVTLERMVEAEQHVRQRGLPLMDVDGLRKAQEAVLANDGDGLLGLVQPDVDTE